ncbi:MAG: mandelate racemase/muconate lactonizing enzyme family protein [Chloroflexi bacterium]|nr:mandelate racemase/muconate lactonizing enzyme family protein [Chloroflexota bacterium]MCC6891747.1 mandelate racemase/muconate lactonizing enzyme family protein [Anaerolineae bacterium]
MKITRFETLMANAGLRNYLFIRLHTDTGLTGIGEASLEWQERTVQTVAHEWVEGRVLGYDPFDIERVVGNMIRDQYQGGSTVMTAISGVEIAMWDIIGKACGQPVYKLIGGRYHRRIPAYANGWYGGAHTPSEFAERAQEAVGRGYRGLKFDPFGTAWKDLGAVERESAIAIVAAVREAVGPAVDLMIEFHGRLSVGEAILMMRELERFKPAWCEEPVAPENLDLLAEVKCQARSPIAAGERLYTLADFYRLTTLRAADVVQMDVAHCGGIGISKKIAAMAAAQDMRFAPHCSVGPVSLAAALHLDVSSPNFMVQESFAEFDVPWRNDLVRGWNPIRNGEFFMDDKPGLGLELDDDAIAQHPYIQNPFPSLWDGEWITDFTQDKKI